MKRVKQPDLLGRGFPSGDWNEPAERLEELYQWVEQEAMRLVEWYLADRVRKRRWARWLRGGVVAGAAVGALVPLADLAGVALAQGHSGYVGYVALLFAAVCALADRWLGLTSGWMRDVAAALAVHRRLEMLRYEWAAENVREVLGPAEGSAGEAAERALAVLRRFSEDVNETVRAETVDWMVSFRTAGSPLLLASQSVGPAGRGTPVRRLPPPPNGAGGWATMPRQRPPGG
ncbi:SLATT domain-containing protein [Streptomyces sp. CA-250714]|uniref:SLATT domain-containing protein n=1 Tax=Streptomyces sp. CA-250714 TaxID=3240060 RepID=UPI003D8A0A97